jgi:hypothetical protein
MVYTDVLADWVRLEWLPSRFRNKTSLLKFIIIEVEMIDGQPFYAQRSRHGSIEISGLYINPISNILSAVRKRRKPSYLETFKADLSKKFVPLGDYNQYCKIGGVWYEIELSLHKRHVKVAAAEGRDDPVFYTTCPLPILIKSKKQLNTKTLRKAGLCND